MLLLPCSMVRTDRTGLSGFLSSFIPKPWRWAISINLIFVFVVLEAQSWLEGGMHFYFWLGVMALGWAGFLLVRARSAGRHDWAIEKATPLPLNLLNPRDDAWVSGRIECTTPLTVPHFGQACVAFEFQEQALTRQSGEVRWETVNESVNRVDFDIVDRKGRITVNVRDAQFDGLTKCGNIEGLGRRFTASYLPCPGDADAVGSVSEDRTRLEAYANIPLIVTARNRLAYIGDCSRQETTGRTAGDWLLWLGVFGVSLGILTQLEPHDLMLDAWNTGPSLAYVPAYLHQGLGLLQWANVFSAACFATAVVGVYLIASLYNRLVTLRERVKTAWRHIDVDLENRYNLIPELVRIIKGYSVHETAIAETLARLRYDPATGVGLDRKESALVSLDSVWTVAERYQNLKADQSFRQLQNELRALEEKIAYARGFYNRSLLNYDNARHRFPANIVAHAFARFPTYEPFGSDEVIAVPEDESGASPGQ